MGGRRPIRTAELIISIRNFIRAALDLGPVPDDVDIPLYGPTRAQGGGGRNKSNADKAVNENLGLRDAGAGMGVGLGMGRKEG